MLHDFWQIAMQQGFAPIEANAVDPELLAVIQQIPHDGPRQLRSGHEIAAIPATLAAQIAVRG
jgi:hypothetical protein